MRIHTLTRYVSNLDGTFGHLIRWNTVEEEWLNNEPNQSCIPEGVYVCERSYFHRGGYPTFEVTNVPGRSLIKFHVANTEEDLSGCIGPGLTMGTIWRKDEETGTFRHKLGVVQSRDAFNEFMEYFEGVDRWILQIIDLVNGSRNE